MVVIPKVGTSPVKNLLVGAVVGFVAGFIWEKANIMQGQNIDLPVVGSVKVQTAVFAGISIVLGVYGLIKKQTHLLMFGVGFFAGSYFADLQF